MCGRMTCMEAGAVVCVDLVELCLSEYLFVWDLFYVYQRRGYYYEWLVAVSISFLRS